jgi:hypothetical protein
MMKPAYAVYVLEVEWSWDHSNREFATLTVEGTEGNRYEPEFEKLLDPTFPPERKVSMLDELRRVTSALNRSAMGEARMRCLYRVTDYDGVAVRPVHPAALDAGHAVMMQMWLQPICRFDADGAPVAAQNRTG